MRYAIVADIHANLPALQSVLKHAKGNAVEAFWFVGDCLGYGAFPDEVVTELRVAHAVCIIGNYDLKVLRFKRKKKRICLNLYQRLKEDKVANLVKSNGKENPNCGRGSILRPSCSECS